MNFLSLILPGLREVRAPLAAGWAWLLGLTGVLWSPLIDAWSRLIRADPWVIDTGKWIGSGVLLVCLSVLAYVIGTISMAITATLVSVSRWIIRVGRSSIWCGLAWLAARVPEPLARLLVNASACRVVKPTKSALTFVLDLLEERWLAEPELLKRVADRPFAQPQIRALAARLFYEFGVSWSVVIEGQERRVPVRPGRGVWLDQVPQDNTDGQVPTLEERQAALTVSLAVAESLEPLTTRSASIRGVMSEFVDVPRHTREITKELEVLSQRVEVAGVNSWERIDRMRAEAQFRLALVLPLLSTAGLLGQQKLLSPIAVGACLLVPTTLVTLALRLDSVASRALRTLWASQRTPGYLRLECGELYWH